VHCAASSQPPASMWSQVRDIGCSMKPPIGSIRFSQRLSAPGNEA